MHAYRMKSKDVCGMGRLRTFGLQINECIDAQRKREGLIYEYRWKWHRCVQFTGEGWCRRTWRVLEAVIIIIVIILLDWPLAVAMTDFVHAFYFEKNKPFLDRPPNRNHLQLTASGIDFELSLTQNIWNTNAYKMRIIIFMNSLIYLLVSLRST